MIGIPIWKIANLFLAFSFNLCKAFDSVPHQALLNKLHKLNVSVQIFYWTSNYLFNRSQQVASTSCHVWGSILGPLLFLMYINNLPCSLSVNAKMLLYPNDILLYKPVRSHLVTSFNQYVNGLQIEDV